MRSIYIYKMNATVFFSAVPESEEIATELGLMYLGLGDTKRAFQQFGTALAQSANYAKATLPMAYVMQVYIYIYI